MRKILPFLLVSFFSTFLANSQADRFAYAITDVNKDGSNWSFLRKIDLKTGVFSEVVLNGSDATNLAYDDATKKQLSEPLKDARLGNTINAAFGTGVAALALDKRNNRLYYTPMFIDQLRYIDLKTMKVYFVTGFEFTGIKTKATDQSNIITRMAIGDDGNGYALTNDGNHLLRFTTGKKISVTDLGALVDNPANTTVSVHNSCNSFGGDMIADDDGNLFLFSNRTNVFKVNVETKVATHLGAVSGLPATYTINGSAVDNNNQILISSAVDNSSIYTVDIKTLAATPVKSTGGWRTADLATSNLLATRKPSPFVRLLKAIEETEDGRIQLFPNPVTNNQFTVQFNLAEGNYTVQIKDILGRQVSRTKTNIKGQGQTETFQLNALSGRGVYLVKIIDQNNKTVFTRKILVQ
ncbi:MAG: T9SS type A sorting domain-containing protein [Chitinophagaceae bacterium]